MTDDARAIAQRMYEAFNARDLTAAKTIFSGSFVSHPLGTDSVVKAWSGLHAMFPDIRVVVEDMLVDADNIAVPTYEPARRPGTSGGTGSPLDDGVHSSLSA
ncbi:ester cyclase [Streptomyces sp. NBC_01335]|uniref:ester cyclase n=1 Tax=Streptomyces sp. NBC_01335 TaxID=2903828 RepID=UPI002E0F34EC|nr:ester cyclase [Streptomyces sp. NBC_01335]